MQNRTSRRFALLFALSAVSAAYAVDEAPQAPESAPTPSGGQSAVRAGKPRTSVISRPKRVRIGQPPGNRRMPPAGSAATGVTSSSPAGAPTTPYGGSD